MDSLMEALAPSALLCGARILCPTRKSFLQVAALTRLSLTESSLVLANRIQGGTFAASHPRHSFCAASVGELLGHCRSVMDRPEELLQSVARMDAKVAAAEGAASPAQVADTATAANHQLFQARCVAASLIGCDRGKVQSCGVINAIAQRMLATHPPRSAVAAELQAAEWQRLNEERAEHWQQLEHTVAMARREAKFVAQSTWVLGMASTASARDVRSCQLRHVGLRVHRH